MNESHITNEDILKSLIDARKVIDQAKEKTDDLRNLINEIKTSEHPVTNEFFYGALKKHNENFQDMQEVMEENNRILLEKIDELTKKIEPVLEIYTSTKGGVNFIKYLTVTVIGFGALIGALKVIFGIHIKL